MFRHLFFNNLPYKRSFLTKYRCYSSYFDDILARTTEISDVNDCLEVVNKLYAPDSGILGVDIEGIQGKPIRKGESVNNSLMSLIQIRGSSSDDIYLFRTGLNPELMGPGGLTNLLMDPKIVKVFHAAANDIGSLYANNVKVWNIYDTALAHKVYQYQTIGRLISTAGTIGYNDLCEYHGFTPNPMKQKMKGRLWQRVNEFHEPKPLNNSLKVYCASDVDQLLDLYYIMESLIDTDFKSLLKKLSEAEIYRWIDPDLTRRFRAGLIEYEKSGLFLEGFSSKINPSHIYCCLSKLDAYKKVYFSPLTRTAHFVSDSRGSTMLAKSILDRISDSSDSPLNGCSVRLLVEDENDSQTSEESSASDEFTDEKSIELICSEVLSNRIPVAMDFKEIKDIFYLEIFVGSHRPIIRTKDFSLKCIKNLFSSSSVPKIFPKLTRISGKGLRLLSTHGVVSNNILDVGTIYLGYDYIKHGVEIFCKPVQSDKDFFGYFGLEDVNRKTKLEYTLYSYKKMNKLLPLSIRTIMEAWSKIDQDILTDENPSNAKCAKKKLRQKLIDNSILVICDDASYILGKIPNSDNVINVIAFEDKIVIEFSTLLDAIEAKTYLKTQNYIIKEWSNGPDHPLQDANLIVDVERERSEVLLCNNEPFNPTYEKDIFI